MAIRRPSINPMDFAKRAGRERNIADVMQDLKRQEAEYAGEMTDYGTQQGLVDIGSSLLASPIVKGLTTLFTGGASAAPSILSSILGIGAKSAGKSFLSKGIGDVLGNLFNVKPPDAPTVDMSKLRGPGMSGARKSITDYLDISDAERKVQIQDLESQSKLLNSLMSFGPGLKEKIPGLGEGKGGMSIADYMKKLLGVDLIPDLNIGERFYGKND